MMTDAAETDVVVKIVVAEGELTEVVVDRIWALGATAVDETDGSVLLVGFPTPDAASRVAAEIGAGVAEVVVVHPDTWRDTWRSFAQPVEIASIVVAPAWRFVPVIAGRLVLEIDSGACFGSGTHPSTRLMLDQIQRRLKSGDKVLDIGTGSGILAVAAAALGAVSVDAVDIEQAALDVTTQNAARNGVGHLVHPCLGSAGGKGAYQVVMANLTAGVQAELAPTTTAAVAPGGHLLLAGLLQGQWSHIADSFASLEMIDLPELDGWTGAVLKARQEESHLVDK